jgi:hypothetical protein
MPIDPYFVLLERRKETQLPVCKYHYLLQAHAVCRMGNLIKRSLTWKLSVIEFMSFFVVSKPELCTITHGIFLLVALAVALQFETNDCTLCKCNVA